ncbi:MAG: right-handed parallel beta-helix repeat-containing protein [Opitutaceae bacterium]|nr:right-handed parallel beta-helix repeat-containing protein [Opitutaceae bacterium]
MNSLFKTLAVGAFALAVSAMPARADRVYFVDALNGADTNNGLSTGAAFRTLTKARDAVRTHISGGMTEPVFVNLRGNAPHVLAATLALTPADSGRNGYTVTWRAHPGEVPIISGAATVTGWTLHDATNNIWRAAFNPPGGQTDVRWIDVNGVRRRMAVSSSWRTGVDWDTTGPKTAASWYPDDINPTSLVVADSALGYWANPADMELRWDIRWKSHRIPVVDIVAGPIANTKRIILQSEPMSWLPSAGFEGARPRPDRRFYLHNAYELLTQTEGTCYYNSGTDFLYYRPASGENMGAADIKVPVIDGSLLTLFGTSSTDRIRDLSFDGLTFRHTRLARASALGSLCGQAGKWVDGTGFQGADENEGYLVRAALELRDATAVRVENCEFSRLGGAGLTMISGVSQVTIDRNFFADISESAIVGGTWELLNLDPGEAKVEFITVTNNTVDTVAVEFSGAPGMTFYYVQDCVIDHNEIANVPYSGMNVGWGWADSAAGTNKTARNKVRNNYIHDYMNVLEDGGAVYCLGERLDAANRDELSGNYIVVAPPAGPKNGHSGFYFDQGTKYALCANNVFNVPSNIEKGWLNLAFDGNAVGITADVGNFTTLSKLGNEALYENPDVIDGIISNTAKQVFVSNAGVYPTAAWPAAAQTIIQNAGPTTVAAPPAPTGLAATSGDQQVSLAWNAAAGATGYNMKFATVSGGPYTVAASGLTATAYTHTGRTNGVTYYYVVTATGSGGESGNSNQASATPSGGGGSTTVTFTSVAAQDGRILESGENTGVGGTTLSATDGGNTGLRAGDNASRSQWRTVVSFDTAALPDGATITSAVLRLRRGTVVGTNPFTTFGTCHVDIKSGTGFGGAVALAGADFQASADATQVSSLSNAAANGDWSSGTLNGTGLGFVNKTGTTQFRVYFATDDNNNSVEDYIGWYAADNGTAANRPVLEITYQ